MEAAIYAYKSAILNKWNSPRDYFDEKTNGSFDGFTNAAFMDSTIHHCC